MIERDSMIPGQDSSVARKGSEERMKKQLKDSMP